MTTETNDAVPTDAEDTAAVLAIASGEKTYLEPKAEEPKAEETKAEDLGDDAPAEPETDAKADAPKPKKTAQERIDEVTRQKHEIAREKDREIEFWKARALQDSKPAQEAQPTQPPGDGRPDPATYELGVYDAGYIEALTDWKADRAIQRVTAQQDERRKTGEVIGKFQQQSEKLFPDGPPEGLQAFLRIPEVPVGALEVIAASDIGPKLAEYLGDNPAEMNRLRAMSPTMQARELTRVETRLSEPPKATPKTATDAPEPPPQARGAGGTFKVSADTDDFAAFERQYGTSG